jgi:hypothetical protein
MMMGIALLVWIVSGTTIAGSALLVLLAVPAWEPLVWDYMLWVCLGGFIVALPISWIVARQIVTVMNR